MTNRGHFCGRDYSTTVVLT